jgi:flagellar M-ring protein FliF
MNPKAVSVVDDAGSLLSAAPEAQGVDLQRLQYTQQIEQLYTRRIMDMIEPLVGVGNVKAQVSAEMDFSEVESTSEQHRPNQGGEPGTVRSQQIVEDGTAAQAQPAGVPGATTNQPPATGTAPINGAAAPLGVASNADKAGNQRRESVINYEVDKTVKVVREATGTVKRLTAAVVVNHRGGTDPKSGKATSTAIPPEQLEQMTALVRETIGFNKDRGDSVNLVNAPFSDNKAADEAPPAWWMLPDNQDLMREMAFPAGMVLLGLVVLMGMVRPGLKLMKTPATPPKPEPVVPQLSAMLNEEPERPALPVPEPEPEPVDTPDKRLEQAKRLALENPVAVANIVKGWVNGEAS